MVHMCVLRKRGGGRLNGDGSGTGPEGNREVESDGEPGNL